jgi:Tol biopolymer transport system component
MGEVYRARDTRLDRVVAIKILPESLASDPQFRDRFEREARAVSQLAHSHICTLFDVGQQDDVAFLVLEYLDGESLESRLARGGLPLDQALTIAMQIADALSMAHRVGIVHRDLKPGNIFLTKGGAKLLDFGLAKTAAPAVAASGLSMLPTTPPGAVTAQGAILGTFQYMAPEQIEGLDADPRTDIFAFGCVLFEMVTGRKAFEGKTRASLLGAILKDTPLCVSAVQALAPPQLDRVVATCLEKDPDDRYQTARDLLRDLKWATVADVTPSLVATSQPTTSSRAVMVITALLLLVVGAGAGAWFVQASRPVTGMEPIQFTVGAPENHIFGGPPGGGTGPATQLALSPDGRQLAFVARDRDRFQVWIRSAASTTPRALAGTEDAAFPFWSTDGRYVAFFAGGKLKKIAVAGGPAIVLCDAPGARGGTWSRGNLILFGSSAAGGVIQRVSGAGGTPVAVSKIDSAYGDSFHRFPHFLPDGRHFLFTAAVGVCCPSTKPAEIRVGALDSAETIRLVQVESAVQHASGHLLFVRSGTLMAQPFDVSALKMTGEAFPLAEHVSAEGSRYASFSASENGVVAYGHGLSQPTSQLTWRDRSGRVLGSVGEPGTYVDIALSPDDRHVAVTLPSADDRDVWVIDAQRGTTSRLTFAPGLDTSPVWSPDGSRVIYESTRDGRVVLRQKNAANTSSDEVVLGGDGDVYIPTDWSADGRFLLYTRVTSQNAIGVWVLPLFGDKKPFPFVATKGSERGGVFSPDGRWIAYQSNETGIFEVYIQPFPPTGGKYQISRNGGAVPLWRRDGKELFFLGQGEPGLMAVTIDITKQQLEPGIPQQLFATNIVGAGRPYGVARDGQRFLINGNAERANVDPITVVVNWLAAIQK